MWARSSSFLVVPLVVAALAQTASADSPNPGPSPSTHTRELKCLAARAEPWPQGFVKMTIPGKDDQFIPEQRITRITSADGSD